MQQPKHDMLGDLTPAIVVVNVVLASVVVLLILTKLFVDLCISETIRILTQMHHKVLEG